MFLLCDALDYTSTLELPNYITPATWISLELLTQTELSGKCGSFVDVCSML